jgi:hypothetical protein
MAQNQLVNGNPNELRMRFGGRIFLGIRPESNNFWSQRGPEKPGGQAKKPSFSIGFRKSRAKTSPLAPLRIDAQRRGRQ